MTIQLKRREYATPGVRLQEIVESEALSKEFKTLSLTETKLVEQVLHRVNTILANAGWAGSHNEYFALGINV